MNQITNWNPVSDHQHFPVLQSLQSINLLQWRWMQYLPPKFGDLSTRLHGAITHNLHLPGIASLANLLLVKKHWDLKQNIAARFLSYPFPLKFIRIRDSSVGIATDYGLDFRGVGVRIPVGARFFFTSQRLDRLCDLRGLLSSGYRGKAAGAWSWPLTSNYCPGQEYVDLYIHSNIRLDGVVLN
jgi:hypothetical protein